MYDERHPASIGIKDVIAAWTLCLAVAAAGFAYPGLVAGHQEITQEARSAPPAGAAAPGYVNSESCLLLLRTAEKFSDPRE